MIHVPTVLFNQLEICTKAQLKLRDVTSLKKFFSGNKCIYNLVGFTTISKNHQYSLSGIAFSDPMDQKANSISITFNKLDKIY